MAKKKGPKGWRWIRINGVPYYCGCVRSKKHPDQSVCYCGKGASGGMVKKGSPSCFAMKGGAKGHAKRIKCPKRKG